MKVAIVDGCSSARILPGLLRAASVECVHIQSSVKLPSVFDGALAFDPKDYDRCMVFEGDGEAFMRELAAENVQRVIAGVESGVDLAERIADVLQLPTNEPRTARARRSKFEAMKILQACGLSSINSIKTSNAREAITWARNQGSTRFVVKPLDSCGSDGVYLCHTESELEKRFLELLNTTTALGSTNSELIVQPYQSGPEYIVDTVSLNGVHRITDVWVYQKIQDRNDGAFVYDFAVLVPYEIASELGLFDYALQVLDALGVQNGAAHSEIILTNGGPVLVDIGARLCGGMVPNLCFAAQGNSQAHALVQSFVDSSEFVRLASQPYSMQRHAIRVLLHSTRSGTVQSYRNLERICSLASFHDLRLTVKPGESLKKTTDFFSHPGKVDLIHDQFERASADMGIIRELEKEGLFVLGDEQ